MPKKNDIQKNFIKQMKELERDLVKEEKQKKGVFTNTLYKRRFYGYHDIDAEKVKAREEKRKTRLRRAVLYLITAVIFCAPTIIYFLMPGTDKAYDHDEYSDGLPKNSK